MYSPSFYCCSLPCASECCCRRVLCTRGYCCSYGRATPPPSSFPLPLPKPVKKKKKKHVRKCEEDCRGPCNPNRVRSECLHVTKRCDPRCRTRRNRPATAVCALREPVPSVCYPKPVCKLRHPCAWRRQRKVETMAYCGTGGIDKFDAATATDLKANASTSVCNLDVFYAMQKCCEKQEHRTQHQYNQPTQAQLLQSCYECPKMQGPNNFGVGGYTLPPNQHYFNQLHLPNLLQQVQPFCQQYMPQNMQYQTPMPYIPRTFQNMGLGLGAVNTSNILTSYSLDSACPCSTQSPSRSKRCETCGRVLIQNLMS